MRQRVKPWTRWHGGILVPSMSGVGTVTLPVPDAPVIAADTISSSSIEITLVSGEGDVFQIERSLNGSDWTQISSDATFPYAATGLSASTQYYFRSRAQFTGGSWSAWSSVVGDTTEAASGNEFAHGDLVTITGSGFGSHDLNFDFLGYHIEATAVDAQPSSRSGWNFDGTAPRQTKLGYDDGTRGRVLTGATTGTNYNMAVARSLGSNLPLEGRLYASVWLYGNISNLNGGQWKMIRMRNGDSVVDASAAEVYVTRYEGNDVMIWTPGAGNPAMYSSGGQNTSGGAWFRLEMFLTAPSSQGGANGLCVTRVHNGSNAPTNKSYSHSSGANNTNGNLYPNASRVNTVLFQNYIGNGASGTVRQDDHYVQLGTFKRVELCNNATYASATRREIQPLDGWSGSEIAARINRGAFANGTYYAHVIGENNTSLGSREIVLTS